MNQAKEVSIADIKIGKRTRKDMGDIAGLAKSITTIGLLQPIVVTCDLELIVGARRIAAYEHLERKAIPAWVVGTHVEALQKLLAERDENTCRKDFTPEEGVHMARRVEVLEKPRAKQRQRESGGDKKSAEAKSVGTNDTNRSGKRDNTKRSAYVGAAAVGMSEMTYRRARTVVEAAEEDPQYQDLVDKMSETGNVAGAYNQLQKRRKGEPGTPKKRGRPRRQPGSPPPDPKPSQKTISLDSLALKKVEATFNKANQLVHCPASEISYIEVREVMQELGAVLGSYLKINIRRVR